LPGACSGHGTADRHPRRATGGTLLANRLQRLLQDDDVAITVVDRDDRHLYQPGLLFATFGTMPSSRIVR
jgi:sulfide:quinone oxidoreductase